LGNGNGTFKDQTTVATGDAPRSVALGDVNDDGRLDIITANRDSSTVSVLLGNGNGTFQTQTTFATGSSPRSVALGDVNGDGRLDIITANNNGDNASVLLGNGNGTFKNQTTVSTGSTGSNPRAVALGDMNGDGKLDIITANTGNASASVLLGNGDGTFAAQPTFATGSNPRSVTVGDVNGDGKLDIITGNFAGNSVSMLLGSVSVLLGNGNGTFAAQATFETNRPYSVSLGDLNGDGRLDIITASYSSDTTRVLLGNGNGTFAAEVSFAAGDGPLSVALGDLNGDGRLDITTANSSSGDASVLLNSLAFTGQTATVIDTPSIIALTSTNSEGTYTIGDTITIKAQFSAALAITGNPRLQLETGTADQYAIYTSLSTTAISNDTITFTYTVQAGDRSIKLDQLSSTALQLNGGSIKGANGIDANLTLAEPGEPGSLGANAALAIDSSATRPVVPGVDGSDTTYETSQGDFNDDGINDDTQANVATFLTSDGPTSLAIKDPAVNQVVDQGGSVTTSTQLHFDAAVTDANAASGLLVQIGSNDPTVLRDVSDLLSFTVTPTVTTAGNVSGLDVSGITTNAVDDFSASIQEVDIYFQESSTTNGWNALYKKKANGDYYLFNYDPLTGLGAMLLDRDNNGSIDGAKIFLKDGELGDFDEVPNGQIVDPIGFTSLSVDPTLRVSNDGKGLTVDGIAGTGLWISLDVNAFNSSTQGNLELYNASSGDSYGAIGATLGSGPTGAQSLYLAAGSTLSFRYSNGAGQINSNPALRINPSSNGFTLGLDVDLNGVYTDLMLDIRSAIAASSPASLAIARKQLASSDAILDLTSIAASGITLTLDISTDCGLRNRFGFVKLDPLTGTTYQVNGVSQNDGAAFRSAVLSQFLDPYQGTGTSHLYNKSRQTITWNLDSSEAGYYAPVMITQGGEVLTFGATTASDGRQHVKLLGTNTFGFEDLLASQGSDWDFNDTKIRVSVSA
jgi:hypothetical protein